MKKKTDKPTLPKEKPNYVVIQDGTNKNIDKLFEIYAIDKAKARAYYYINNITTSSYKLYRIVAFEYSNGDIRVASIIKRYGISTNNKIYNHESNEWVIIYKKETNKYYFQRNYKFKGLCLDDIEYKDGDDLITYLSSKLPVIRTAVEQRKNCWYFGNVQMNVIARKKIFSRKAMLRHIWNVPYKVGEILSNTYRMQPSLWNEIKQSLYNIENIRPGLFDDKYFRDTRKFAAALGKKINCAWSEKRLKLQHDIWAKEVVNIILDFEELKVLKVNQIFLDFAEYSGIQIFKTNHELIEEGKRMSHCVGTYSGEVDAGRSGIYSYGVGTLELGSRIETNHETKVQSTNLYIKQYQGYDNKDVPREDYNFIRKKIKDFNESIPVDNNYEMVEDDLPF